MATLDSNDLKAIKDLMEVTIEEAIEKSLATKDEFYEKMDEAKGELKAIREEVTVLGHQVSDHEARLEKLESDQDMSSN